ncbi:MAG: hypothetical protein CXR30_13865 [Geobacter sp.]|nr:MAG: hypothetical protein CXR30_13865 [Geobacter sp.]
MKNLLIAFTLISFTVPTMAIADGRTDYKAFCAGCHGANANVSTKKAKALKMDVRKLALRTSKMNKSEMIDTIQKGKDKMPSFNKQLSKERISAIADYVISLR